jgi:uncharacterized protein DUF3631
MDRRIRQTATASPAEPGGLPLTLGAMEARPWSRVIRGSPLTTAMLAQLLKPFLIQPGEVKTASGRRANGYRRERFADVFRRYAARE